MSEVQICNRALTTYLGVSRITSLAEASPAAEQCNLHFEDTLNALLEDHWWNFATGREALAELTNDRPEWQYRYARPATALSIRWVNDPYQARHLSQIRQIQDVDRDVTADSIYCDVPGVHCEFTKKITDTSILPQYFKDALSAAMAAAMALPLTEDTRKASFAQDQAVKRLDIAIARDERNSPPVDWFPSPNWMQARGVY